MGINHKYTRIITKSVWVLSLVSLFTDISSEMLYPIMPLYLKSIGFSIVLIGVLEGFAEGIRTGARDALLSDEATSATKGTVFGFHRSMDTLGAAIGPLIALAYR